MKVFADCRVQNAAMIRSGWYGTRHGESSGSARLALFLGGGERPWRSPFRVGSSELGGAINSASQGQYNSGTMDQDVLGHGWSGLFSCATVLSLGDWVGSKLQSCNAEPVVV